MVRFSWALDVIDYFDVLFFCSLFVFVLSFVCFQPPTRLTFCHRLKLFLFSIGKVKKKLFVLKEKKSC